MVTRILELSRQNPEQLKELEKFRRSVAVLFTDIQGSTAYFEKFGDLAGLAMVHECNDALSRVVEEHGGRVIKNIGDAIMACFDNCEQSVRATIVMQRRLSELNARKSEEDRSRVRIGVHHGVGIVKSNDVFGDVVNVASRIQSLAQPEQILISDSLFQEVANCGFDITPLGRFQLKGKSETRQIFEVRWNGRSAAPNFAQTVLATEIPRADKLTIQHLNRAGKVDAERPL
ncbi:MAG TPA: adenylate/guanylate cyclase domain-containing protein, partial [Terriglobales bacterium]|nr:adenylate/guanylate cyclase domain-containing protein [Terriglobales bacterium]